ncbi:MAG: 3-oxoacyl-[acyl-carrier-protein] synthase III C-terminal domain-containing protein [Terracidiphilus sp.]
MNLNVRIAAAAYAVPPNEESVAEILEREQVRVETTLAPLTPLARQRALDNLGLSRVRVCRDRQPYDLVLQAAKAAIDEAGIAAQNIDLILDYSTFPGENTQSISFAHRLSVDLGAETSMNLSFRAGGCGALHMAVKTALGWMSMDERIQTALLVTGDTAPRDNRSLLPITVQGDAASAVVLRRQGAQGPLILGVEAMMLGHLHQAISLTQNDGRIQLTADAVMIEHKVMPIFYLHLFRLANKVLADAGLRLNDVDHFIYSNISRRDREGFRRIVGLPEGGLPATRMAEFGHTFASDLVINYAEMRNEGLIRPGQLLLFASAGIGFAWGVTLARA